MSCQSNNKINPMEKLESRLRSKKNNNKSQLNEPSHSKNHSKQKNTKDEDEKNIFKRPVEINVDDSLTDFKLPKLSLKPLLTEDKVKVLNNKLRAGSREKKRGVSRKKSTDVTNNQSPFFKPTGYACPLCLKSFNTVNLQTTHTKSCAVKNNVSTKKLIAATELQERQAVERVSIGLPAAPFQQIKNKSSNTKKMVPPGDPDIQLAMALSMSLTEIETQEHFNEALALAAETNDNILQMSSSQRSNTLQSFGFITNKPAVEPAIERPRRKKKLGPTVLETRTRETRERLLSDKIAEVLIGTDSITQIQSDEMRIAEKQIAMMPIQSDTLKKIYNPNSELWNQSASTKQCSAYYVKNLCPFISPKNISEVQSHNTREDNVEINLVSETCNAVLPIEVEQPKSLNKNCNNVRESSLASSWSKMVNSNAYSDLIIHVKNKRYIYCHEIVLWTRCQVIQQDIILIDENSNTQQRKKIDWSDIHFSSAIKFLEFIYCGKINLEDAQNDSNLLTGIYQLAEKYKINELLDELRGNVDHWKKNSSPLLQTNLNNSCDIQSSRLTASPDIFADMDLSYAHTEHLNESVKNIEISEYSETLPKQSETLAKNPRASILECSTADKNKNDLSAFIENVKRKNARSLSDSDSETEIQEIKKYQINPFKIKNFGEDSLLSINLNSEKSLETDLKEKKKSALSLLEDEIRARMQKTPEKLIESQYRSLSDVESVENENSDDDDDDDEDEKNSHSDEDKNVSMYTKYKKTHRGNSIADYRNILKSFMEKGLNSSVEYNDDVFNDNKEEMEMNKNEISVINKIRLAELSAFDIYENETPNSISTSSEDSVKERNLSPMKSPIAFERVLSDTMNENSSVNKSPVNEKTLDYNKELEFDDWNFGASELNDWQPLTQSKSQCNESDAPIDLTQSDDEEDLQNDGIAHIISDNVTNIMKNKNSIDTTTKNSDNKSNTIDVSSCSKAQTIANGVSFIANDYQSHPEDELTFENDIIGYVIEGGADNRHCKLSCDTEEFSNSSRLLKNNKSMERILKPISNSLTRSTHSISSDSDDELSKLSINSQCTMKRPRCLSESPKKTENSPRFLTTKSKSGSNFTSRQKISNDSFVTPTKKLLIHLNLTSNDCKISLNASPREDYDALTSPELNKKLNEFGLRNQKRHRALKLLNYIYDQVHPLVPKSLLTSNRTNDISFGIDEQVNNKSRENSESDDENSNDSSNSLDIAVEVPDFLDEDEEFTEEKVILVREAFQKLIDKDPILYNKILTYEPIPLESVHEKLKNSGIKSGLRLLADYLDDECITFFMEHSKKRYRQNIQPRKRKKK